MADKSALRVADSKVIFFFKVLLLYVLLYYLIRDISTACRKVSPRPHGLEAVVDEWPEQN